jgi:acyl-CoA dehydrogenase
MNAVFQNGPTRGTDVFIPIDAVIGGAAQVGRGWRMLMECLAAGRAISLPASATGMAKLAVHATGAYAAIRRQFNMPVGGFEAVAAPLGRMGGHLYAMDACRLLSAAAIDAGEKPSVVSAIVKYHVTERARLLINDAMDVAGGKGICMGPGNFLARAYQQAPIAITVEGANIITRALIIFGQGAIRCHPFILPLMRAAAEEGEAGLRGVDAALFGAVDHLASNLLRVVADGLTGGRWRAVPRGVAPVLAADYRRVSVLSSVLALASDVAMGTLGGTLKRREDVTARLGDVLSQLFIASAVLKRFEDDGRQEADLPLVRWALDDAFERAHAALRALCRNFPVRAVGVLLRVMAFPFGVPAAGPSDRLTASVARIVQTPSAARERLVCGRWRPRLETDGLASLDLAFESYGAVAAIERRLREAGGERIGRMPQALPLVGAWADEALAAGLIGEAERAAIGHFVRHAEVAIAVDDFAPDFNAGLDAEARAAHVAPVVRAAE